MPKPVTWMTVLLSLTLIGCGSRSASSKDYATFSYALSRQYIGTTTNELTITTDGDSMADFHFSLNSPGSIASVPQDTSLPLMSQTITFNYGAEGVYHVDFKVEKPTSAPYLFEVLAWEYSTERPDPPIISFGATATKTLANNLLISDNRVSNTTDLWLTGDISQPTGSEAADDGFWLPLDSGTVATPITLTPGDGVKIIEGKFGNIYGNAGDIGVPAEIILKQNPPTNCDAEPLNATISNNKLSIRLSAQDPYATYYSATGDIGTVVDHTAFDDGDIIDLYVEPSAGSKSVTISIEDLVGNICLDKTIEVTLDPNYESEGIFVQGSNYWTDSENITVDVAFDHFSIQDPLTLKLTGDVSGPNTGNWLTTLTDVAVTLNPTTSGSRVFYAQYKDVDGTESYLIARRIFLKPTMTLNDLGGGDYEVIASNILDADSITITGCVEVYDEAAYQAAFPCQKTGAVDLTYNFPDGTTLTKSQP